MDRELWHRHRKAVRALFMDEWDPLGLSGALKSRDEYDAYAQRAWTMAVVWREPAEAVAAYLVEVETGLAGATPDADVRARRVAAALVAMRDA